MSDLFLEPYPTLQNKEVLAFLTGPSPNRLGRPSNCPNEVYKVMLDCWNENPQSRPTFTQIIIELKKLIHQNQQQQQQQSPTANRNSYSVMHHSP
jgi:hypothetical protein